LFQSTHLALTIWFLAIYLVSQAKTGLSALDLKRQLGVSYPTASLIQHKLMQAMAERDAPYSLCGHVQVDDAYLGGELTGGKAGRGSENKVPLVAAVSLNYDGHLVYVKMAWVAGFTRKAIGDWARTDLSPDCVVMSDGLACLAGAIGAGCQHQPLIVGGRKPKDLPEFNWVNTILVNLKTRNTAVLTMPSTSPNTVPATWPRSLIGSTDASIWRRFPCTCSPPPLPSAGIQSLGFV